MISRKDVLISFLFFLIFIAITLPGIEWGVPSFWHPDELAKNVDKMLQGTYRIDATYFNHPFLPIHIYKWLGKLTNSLGHATSGFLLSARLLNVLLAGGIIAMVYRMTRRVGAGILGAGLAAAFTLSSSEIALNARIAHDDIFLAFFTTLAVLCLIEYRRSEKRFWLMASFFAVGLAASSKYNGVSLAAAPAAVLLLDLYRRKWRNFGSALISISAGFFLVLSGFLIGTPEAVTLFSFFFTSIQTSMLHHAEFNRQSGTPIGLLGQWKILLGLLGFSAAFLFLIALVYQLFGLFRRHESPWSDSTSDPKAIEVVLFSLLALDLPMLIVFNYPARFFVPVIPLLGILAGIFLEDLYRHFRTKGLAFSMNSIGLVAVLVIGLSLLRVISVSLLFQHDARIPASAFVAGLPKKTSIEYTFYPPTIPEKHFSRRNTYPLFFSKSMLSAEPAPGSSAVINQGEPGLDLRHPDYLVVDSLTLKRFADPQTCADIPNECEFFQRLPAGETRYRLLEKFEYRLPKFLPHISPFFLNPTIWIYDRIDE